MIKLFYICQRKQLNDLHRDAENPREVKNKFMDNLIDSPGGYEPKEELEIAYKKTMEFYKK